MNSLVCKKCLQEKPFTSDHFFIFYSKRQKEYVFRVYKGFCKKCATEIRLKKSAKTIEALKNGKPIYEQPKKPEILNYEYWSFIK